VFVLITFTSGAQGFLNGGQVVYPNIRLTDLKIDDLSGSKMIFQFKVANNTKNSIRLDDIDLIISIGSPAQASESFQFTEEFQYIDVVNLPLSHEIYSIRNKPISIVPGGHLSVKVVLKGNMAISDFGNSICKYLKVTVIENPNPYTLPDFFIKKIFNNRGGACN
jgi:hypothetical protein